MGITFTKENIDALKKCLNENKEVTIVTHFNPDGDALGSLIGLKLYLERMNLKVDGIFPSECPPYYDWVPGISNILLFKEKDKLDFEKYFSEDRIIFCLDFNHTSRVQGLSSMLSNSKALKILIDHHQEPSDEFDINFSFPGLSSTCEIIYDIICQIDKSLITVDIGTCLYTGLITDTGGFQFSSTQSSTHQMAADLIDLGINPNEIYNHSFNNFSLNRLMLFGYCIANNMKIFHEKRIAYIWIDKFTKEKFDIKDGDTEGLVNYPLKVKDIEMAVLFKEDYDKIRISFRSKNDIDVSKIAKTHFNGGGHINAAGGMSKMKLKETLIFFEKVIEDKI